MLEEYAANRDSAEIGNISNVASSLRRKLSDLQRLEVHDSRLHFAMSTTRHSIRQRVDMLSGIAESLKGVGTPERDRELRRRAERLIYELSDELEQLAEQAEHDFDWIA